MWLGIVSWFIGLSTKLLKNGKIGVRLCGLIQVLIILDTHFLKGPLSRCFNLPNPFFGLAKNQENKMGRFLMELKFRFSGGIGSHQINTFGVITQVWLTWPSPLGTGCSQKADNW